MTSNLINTVKRTLLLALLISGGAISAEDCPIARQYKTVILDANAEAISDLINYPVKASFGDNETTIHNAVIFEIYMRMNLTDYVREQIHRKNDCEFQQDLAIDENGKINSLPIFNYPEDQQFSRAGIKSSTQLYNFLNDVSAAIAGSDSIMLATYFRYPFSMVTNGKRVTIESEQDFLQHEQKIVSSEFVSLIDNARSSKTFFEDPEGLRLNYEGDYWIVQVKNRLLIQPVEPHINATTHF